MNLTNISANKTTTKKRKFNEYGLVTELVKKFKSKPDDTIMLEILNNLQGIINTYTLICTPPDIQQGMFITPYMKKFLGMFLSPEERISTTNQTYMIAAQRIRWILRHYSYEDMYAKILELLIEVVRKMKIVGDCDCIYFIQKMTQYKMYDLVMRSSRDATAHVSLMYESQDSEDNYNDEDRYNDKSVSDFFEKDEDIIEEIFYNEVNINSLIEKFDFYKKLTQYEKLLLYLNYGLGYTVKQIAYIIRHKTEVVVLSDLQKLEQKLVLLSQEHKTI